MRERLISAYLFGYNPLTDVRGSVNLRRNFAFPSAFGVYHNSVFLGLAFKLDNNTLKVKAKNIDRKESI